MANKKAIQLFKRLKKLQVQKRVEAANNPEYGRGLLSFLSSLTPTQYAELFPKWYLGALPDVSGFRAALTKKSQKEQQDYFDSINKRLGGGDTGRYEDNRGAASKSEMMKYAMDQLRKEGVPAANLKAAAAHLVGQAYMESGLNPNLKHDNNTGYGIYGARLDRRDRMFGWLSQNGYANNSAEGQMRYMAHEAMNDKKYSDTRNVLMNATTETFERDSATITGNFERPLVNNYRAGAVKAAFSSYGGGEETGSVTAQPVKQEQKVQNEPVVQPQQIVGEVSSAPSDFFNSEPQAQERKQNRKRQDTATVEKPHKKHRHAQAAEQPQEEVPANTPAFAGGGKRKIKGTATVSRLNKKHRGDTAVVRDSEGDQFTVNPEKENISVDKSGNVNVKPSRDQMPMEKLMAVVRRQESGSFEGDYSSDLAKKYDDLKAAGKVKKGQRRDTASGAYQYNDKTWKGVLRDELNMPDILEKYPRAVVAPKEVQDMITEKRFQKWRDSGYTDDEIILNHFTGNRRGILAKGAQKGNPTPAQYKAQVASHKREYDKQYAGGAPAVEPNKKDSQLEAQVSTMPEGEASQQPEVKPTQKTTEAPKPTPEPEPKQDLGDTVRQMAGLSVRSAARQQAQTGPKSTPGSVDISKQPAPTVGPSKTAAEAVNISQTPGPSIAPTPKVDTKAIAPGPTTQMDLLREEMKSGFESITPSTQQAPPHHVRASRPIITEAPDVDHQNMINTLPATAKDPYGGVPSLERAVGRNSFKEVRPTASDFSLGNKN